MNWFHRQDDGISIEVHVVPRASKTRVVGLHDGRLKVQLNAPPVDGKANETLIGLFAKGLGVKKSAVSIRSGETGRNKRLHVEGINEGDLLDWLRKDGAIEG